LLFVFLAGAAVLAYRVFTVPDEKEIALRKCELSSMSNGFPDGWQTWGPDFPRYKAYIETCMGAAGYRTDVVAHHCGVGFFTEHNPWCYSSLGLIDAAAWRVYVTAHGGSIGGLFQPFISYGDFGGVYLTVFGWKIIAPPGWGALITSSPPSPPATTENR
jgi:hypothetical protein